MKQKGTELFTFQVLEATVVFHPGLGEAGTKWTKGNGIAGKFL